MSSLALVVKEDEKEDAFCCPICNEVYQIPMIYTCGHTLCGSCCQKVTECPQCRIKIHPLGWVHNHALEQLVDVHFEPISLIRDELRQQVHIFTGKNDTDSSSSSKQHILPQTSLLARKRRIENMRHMYDESYLRYIEQAVDKVIEDTNIGVQESLFVKSYDKKKLIGDDRGNYLCKIREKPFLEDVGKTLREIGYEIEFVPGVLQPLRARFFPSICSEIEY